MRRVYLLPLLSFMHIWKIFFQTLSALFKRPRSLHGSLSVSLAFENKAVLATCNMITSSTRDKTVILSVVTVAIFMNGILKVQIVNPK